MWTFFKTGFNNPRFCQNIDNFLALDAESSVELLVFRVKMLPKK